MNEYKPDRWVLLKVTPKGKTHFYRILAGWNGSYLDSDSWKLSSGVENIEDFVDAWIMPQSSGSIYYCNKGSEAFTGLSASILESYKEHTKGEASIEVISSAQGFEDVDLSKEAV